MGSSEYNRAAPAEGWPDGPVVLGVAWEPSGQLIRAAAGPGGHDWAHI